MIVNTTNRFAALCEPELPPVEVLPGGIVRRKYVDGVWPFACGELREGRCQRSATLTCEGGDKLDFYVWLHVEKDGETGTDDDYVYADTRGCMRQSFNDRRKLFNPSAELSTRAEVLTIQMI